MSLSWSRVRVLPFALGVAMATPVVVPAAPAGAQGLTNSNLYAYIYEGTCETFPAAEARFARVGELDEIQFDLDQLFDAGEAEDRMGLPRDGRMIYEEDRDLNTPLQPLLDAPHIVIIRDGDQPADPIVACGEIAGEFQDQVLRIELMAVDGSEVAGIALLEPETNVFGGSETEVTVQVTRGAAATPTP